MEFFLKFHSVDAGVRPGPRFLARAHTQYSSKFNPDQFIVQSNQFKVQLNSTEFTSKLNSNQPWFMWFEIENPQRKMCKPFTARMAPKQRGEYALLEKRAEISDPFLSIFERIFQGNRKIGRPFRRSKKTKKKGGGRKSSADFCQAFFCTNNCNDFVHLHTFCSLRPTSSRKF